ncbi:MAG: transposase [Halobacteriota archaeon]
MTPEGAGALLADKGYDSDAFIQAITEKGLEPVIPPKSNSNHPRICDWAVYKERHLIECFFSKMKHYRRVFSCYDKTAKSYMGFFTVGFGIDLDKINVNRT